MGKLKQRKSSQTQSQIVVWENPLVCHVPKASHLFQGLLFSPRLSDTLSPADNMPTMDPFSNFIKVSEGQGASNRNSFPAKFAISSQKAHLPYQH